jgi:predicted nucleotidyltransferase
MKFGVEKAYLFDSYARGQARPDSDIDILQRDSCDLQAMKKRLGAIGGNV